jgi:hypothetical protein
MRFRATLELGGKTATGIRVPDDVVAAIGAGKRPPVTVTINGYTYRSTIAVMGGAFMLPVSAEHRDGAGVAAGDEVDVDLELDTAPREVALPEDLASVINSDDQAWQFFEGLSPSYKKAYVTWIESAKKAETRQSRLDKAVSLLRDGRKQP